MGLYVHRTSVKSSLECVTAFHRDPNTLKVLTPPGMFIRFKKLEPLQENSIADFAMWLGPLPIHWVAIHSEVNRDGFIDTQLCGPFKSWKHRHSFNELGDGKVEITDRVEFVFGAHPFWGLISCLMGYGLPVLFAYRGWATRRRLEAARP